MDKVIIFKGLHGVSLSWSLYSEKTKAPYDLTGKTVFFRLWSQTAPCRLLIDGKCTVVDATMGKVEYDIKPGDFDCPDRYYGQFVVLEDGVDNVPFTPFEVEVVNTAVPR